MSKPAHDIDVVGDETIEHYEKKHELDDTQAQNAVGYQEYVEGLDIEVTDREVLRSISRHLQTRADFLGLTGKQDPLENRSHSPPNVPYHTSVAIHG
jgi:hypothetical protein